MSDVKLWPIEIVIPTTCSATFQETAPKIGETISAVFKWENAIKHYAELWYAQMSITSPSGVEKIKLIELWNPNSPPEGKTLSYVVDELGTWTCKIWAGDTPVTHIEATDDEMAYGVMATLTLDSVYHKTDPDTGIPFIPGTVGRVCDLDIKNTGNVSGKLMWQIYSFAPDENLEDEGTSVGDYAPEAIWPKPISITIPPYPGEISMDLGVKVKGPLEAWPTWPLGLATGRAKIIRLGNGTPTWVAPVIAVVAASGLLGTAYYVSKH